MQPPLLFELEEGALPWIEADELEEPEHPLLVELVVLGNMTVLGYWINGLTKTKGFIF